MKLVFFAALFFLLIDVLFFGVFTIPTLYLVATDPMQSASVLWYGDIVLSVLRITFFAFLVKETC